MKIGMNIMPHHLLYINLNFYILILNEVNKIVKTVEVESDINSEVKFNMEKWKKCSNLYHIIIEILQNRKILKQQFMEYNLNQF
jgi:rubrerythrin